jgi:hypothetical protein
MNAADVELHGIVAMFATPDAFLGALRRAREGGFSALEVNVPFAVGGMDELLPGRRTPMAGVVLAGGLLGAGGGYLMQWFAARDYALNVGGRPLHSWPAFVPVTFELGVLCASLAGVGALLWLCRLPRLDYPMFRWAEFARASQDRFFVCIRADDPRFDTDAARELFKRVGAEWIEEVRK